MLENSGADGSSAMISQEEDSSVSRRGLMRARPVGIAGYVLFGSDTGGPVCSEVGGKSVVVTEYTVDTVVALRK